MPSTNVTVFIPAYAEADEREIRLQLLAQRIYPVFWGDLYSLAQTVEAEDNSVKNNALFDMACEGIKQHEAMAVPESYTQFDQVKQLISFCKANNIPCHIIQKDYTLRPPWATK